MLPTAVDREPVVAAARREDRRVRVYSLNMDEEADLVAHGVRQRGLWRGRVELKEACRNVLTVTRPDHQASGEMT